MSPLMPFSRSRHPQHVRQKHFWVPWRFFLVLRKNAGRHCLDLITDESVRGSKSTWPGKVVCGDTLGACPEFGRFYPSEMRFLLIVVE